MLWSLDCYQDGGEVGLSLSPASFRTDGTFLGVAEGREESPLLTETEWEGLLRRTGFSGLDICARDVPSNEWSLSTIASTKQQDATVRIFNDVTVVHTSPASATWAQHLTSKLHCSTSSSNSRVMAIDDLKVSKGLTLLIDDQDKTLLMNLTEPRLRALQQIAASGKGLLWVTFGGQLKSENAEAGAVPGFVRALRSEFGSTRCVVLDLQSSGLAPDGIPQILAVLNSCFWGDPASDLELEYAERDGVILIPRIFADRKANEVVKGRPETPSAQPQPLWQTDNFLCLRMRHAGLLDSFEFFSNLRIQDTIGEDEVEIKAQATALNFHDLMVATGQLDDNSGFGVECSGFITNIGSAVNGLHIGQRVCALASSCFSTHTRTSKNLICEIPDSMSFDVAATIPSVFSTSYYSLHNAAQLHAGETILIHSASGGVGQACIKLASLIGATIIATVGSPTKADFLEKIFGRPRSHILNSRDLSFGPKVMALTGGKGVDVMVNSLARDALRESWRCIAMFDRFIKLEKKDSIDNAYLGMAPFEKSASFIAVGFDYFGAYKSAIAGEALRTVVGMFAQKKLTPIEPITTYTMSNVKKSI